MAIRTMALVLAMSWVCGGAMAQTSLSTPPVLSVPNGQAATAPAAPAPAAPCVTPKPETGRSTPQVPGCRTDAPPDSAATKVNPGAGVMLTSPTGMMSDPGHQPMPNAAPTGGTSVPK